MRKGIDSKFKVWHFEDDTGNGIKIHFIGSTLEEAVANDSLLKLENGKIDILCGGRRLRISWSRNRATCTCYWDLCSEEEY